MGKQRKVAKDYLSQNAKTKRTAKEFLDELYDQLRMADKDKLDWQYKIGENGIWIEATRDNGEIIKLGYGNFE